VETEDGKLIRYNQEEEENKKGKKDEEKESAP
jgi:hypothetical protein